MSAVPGRGPQAGGATASRGDTPARSSAGKYRQTSKSWKGPARSNPSTGGSGATRSQTSGSWQSGQRSRSCGCIRKTQALNPPGSNQRPSPGPPPLGSASSAPSTTVPDALSLVAGLPPSQPKGCSVGTSGSAHCFLLKTEPLRNRPPLGCYLIKAHLDTQLSTDWGEHPNSRAMARALMP